jgi:hypothetical protein
MLQQVVVVLVVVLAALFSVWKLMPARRRLRMLQALDTWSATRPGLSRWRERWLKPRIVRAAGVGCDGCAAHDSTPPHRPR